MTKDAVVIENVNLSYHKTAVFDNINLVIKKGCIYGVLGKNGSGKSSLLYLISGLLRPQGGRVNVFEHDRPWERDSSLLQDVFLVPEEFYLPDISIENLLKYHSPFYPSFDSEVFHSHLKTFEIPDHTLLKMSYGQKKKVLISFALATNVSLLLMDEPTNGLDIVSKKQFRKVISGALKPSNTIIISSHQVHDLANLIDHVIVLDEPGFAIQRSLREIGERLTFSVSESENEIESALFSERSLAGTHVVLPNASADEGNIDLELFYKALMANRAGITYTLNE
jgi:ABC-2 type transport system ATP-binding protein